MGGINSAPDLGATSRLNQKTIEEKRIQEATEFLKSNFEIATGLQIDTGNKEEKKFVPGPDPNHPIYPMKWNRHHDTVAAVSPNGELMIAPWTQKLENRLRSLSFTKEEGMGVPMSNNEMPIHPDVRRRWEDRQARAFRENREAQMGLEAQPLNPSQIANTRSRIVEITTTIQEAEDTVGRISQIPKERRSTDDETQLLLAQRLSDSLKAERVSLENKLNTTEAQSNNA